MELTILSKDGKETGRKAKLDDSIFGFEPNDHAIYLDVKYIRANRRQGTHKAKERAEIKGSTRKLRKQKGSGSARVGSISNPIFRGGGRAFGPRVSSYSSKLNKKMRKVARKSAIAYKIKEENLHILEDFSFDKIKTKDYASMLKNLNMHEGRSLLVMAGADNNIIRSASNIQNAEVTIANSINTYDLLKAKHVLIVESSVKEIETLLSE